MKNPVERDADADHPERARDIPFAVCGLMDREIAPDCHYGMMGELFLFSMIIVYKFAFCKNGSTE